MFFYRQCYQCFESFKRVTGDGELKGETVIVGEDEPLFGYVQLADVPFVDDKSFTYAHKCGGLFAQLLVKSSRLVRFIPILLRSLLAVITLL